MLISDYRKRTERTQRKQQILLQLLRDETWTSASIAAQWLNLSLSGAYKTLVKLERDKLIKAHYIEELKFKIWGITSDGLLQSWQDHELMQDRVYFQPSKIKPVMIQHHLDLQQARFNAEDNEWTNWLPGKLLSKNITKRPDAVAHDVKNQVIAIEVERTVKTKRRYEAIFSHYLQAIKLNEYDSVHYVCPSKKFASSLTRLFALIEAVPVAGNRVRLLEKHRAKFEIYYLHNWPPIFTKSTSDN